MPLEIEHANFILKYMTEIVIGLIVVLLSALKLLGQKTQAEAVKTSLAAQSVTKVEMLEYQIETAALIREEFDKLRLEMREEISVIHRRVDKLKTNN